MAEENDKLVEALSKIILETQLGHIKWKSAPAPDELNKGVERPIRVIFLANFLGKNLRLYEWFYQDYADYFSALSLFNKEDKREKRWFSIIILEILDKGDRPIWRFPDVSPLKDLLTAVKYQVSGVSDFIDAVLHYNPE